MTLFARKSATKTAVNNSQPNRVRLDVQCLETRDVPALLTETTTLTTWGGGEGTASLTVTVNEAGDFYEWDYHLVNDSIDYTPDSPGPPIGIGLFGIASAPGVLVESSVTSPSGWHSEPGSLLWMASGDYGLSRGGSVDFTFRTARVEIVDWDAEISDPSWAAGGGGPAMVPGNVPSIDLNITGLADATEAQAPGKRIHINDNFDEGQQTANERISDFRPDPVTGMNQINPADGDLANGSVTVNATQRWIWRWTVDPQVKAWYKDFSPGNTFGKWVEAKNNSSANFGGPAPGKVDLKIEGVDIGPGSVKVDLFMNGADGSSAPIASDEVAVSVYTGLKITGPLATQAYGQLAATTGWTIANGAAGDIWRAAELKNSPQWQIDARGIMEQVFLSDKQTAVDARNDKLVQPGNFNTNAIDPADFAIFFSADVRLGAGVVVHELIEQYYKQVFNDSYAVAHIKALVHEAMVVAGGGTRMNNSPKESAPGIYPFTFVYQNGIIAEFILDVNLATNISQCQVRRP